MRLGENGKASSGRRTRHFDIKYFYVTDLIDRKELKIEYCSTATMIAEYMTKPLTGGKFKLFRDRIMNLSDKHHRIKQQECVGRKVSASESTESSDASEWTLVTAKNRVPKNKNTRGPCPVIKKNTRGPCPVNKKEPVKENGNKNVKESDSENESVNGFKTKDSLKKRSKKE